MDAHVYQQLASRTINKELNQRNLLDHAVFGLCAEAGEVASILQHVHQGKPLCANEVLDEISDVLWFAAEVCTALGLELDDAMTHNISKLMKRYPDGFDAVRSENRHSYGEEAYRDPDDRLHNGG